VSAGIAGRLAAVRERIADAARRAGRDPDEIRLVGVSKRFPAADVVAAVRAGLDAVGENYVQEAVPKLEEACAALDADGLARPRLHFIGQLQRNKARQAAGAFDVVETLDRPALGQELDKRAGAAGRRIEVFLQVDVSGEAQKGGVAPEALPGLLEASSGWSHLAVTGLMAIPAPAPDPRPAFARLRSLRDALGSQAGGEALRELSMGMSGDFEQAIEEGATVVRVGTAIFGQRPT
jgi:pyridoxal phosphate enzyme (YggS family)